MLWQRNGCCLLSRNCVAARSRDCKCCDRSRSMTTFRWLNSVFQGKKHLLGISYNVKKKKKKHTSLDTVSKVQSIIVVSSNIGPNFQYFISKRLLAPNPESIIQAGGLRTTTNKVGWVKNNYSKTHSLKRLFYSVLPHELLYLWLSCEQPAVHD